MLCVLQRCSAAAARVGPDSRIQLPALQLLHTTMDNVDLNVLRQITQWVAAGHRVVLGTITRTWGSAPRPPGSAVAVRDDGQIGRAHV